MENEMNVMIQELKNSKYKTIVWGGLMARHIGPYLDKEGVPFSGFAVNKQFLKNNTVFGYPCCSIEDFVENTECNVIIGFQKFEDRMLNALKKENIKKVFKVDFWGRFPVSEDTVWTEEFLFKNQCDLQQFQNWLCDEKSKKAFNDYSRQKLTCCFWKPYDSTPQYFDREIIRYKNDEIFLDCGSYHGESSLAFIKSLREQKCSFKKIIAFEPDKKNVAIMRENLKDISNIDIHIAGVYSSSGMLSFCDDGATGASNSFSDKADSSVMRLPVEKIDDVAQDMPVSFIKMDIEGSELEALKGGGGVIKKFKPKLAICVYHRTEDIIAIPKLIKSFNPKYKFYLRNYSFNGTETVLYAIDEEGT